MVDQLEELEDTKVVMRISKSKDKGQRTKVHKTLHRQIEIERHGPHE